MNYLLDWISWSVLTGSSGGGGGGVSSAVGHPGWKVELSEVVVAVERKHHEAASTFSWQVIGIENTLFISKHTLAIMYAVQVVKS